MRSALLGLLFASVVAAAPTKPNILLLLADDKRFDSIRALGNDEIHTPNLDQLVARGFHFTNVYCQGSMVPAVCTPSRTMLLTGKSLFRIPNPGAKSYDGPTLPTLFQKAGYATLHVANRATRSRWPTRSSPRTSPSRTSARTRRSGRRTR